MRHERPDHTLQVMALVNEAYIRLIDVNRINWQNRAHFLAVAAQMMRRIIVEFARQRQKRGGDVMRVTIDDARLDATSMWVGRRVSVNAGVDPGFRGYVTQF